MVCQYCKQDIEKPCSDLRQVKERAKEHVERCESALDRQKDASEGQSGGSI